MELSEDGYGPVSSGRGKTSIFVYLLFLERHSWCGMGNEGIKFWSSITFPKWTSNLNYLRNNVNKINLIDFLRDYLRGLFNRLKISPTWALKFSLYKAPTHFLLHTLKESLC